MSAGEDPPAGASLRGAVLVGRRACGGARHRARGHGRGRVDGRHGGDVLRVGRGRHHGGGLDRVAGEVALDVGPHGSGALVAVLDALGEGLHHDRVDLGVELVVEVGRRRRLLADVLVGHGDRAVADEGRPAGEQLIEHAAGGVDVRAGVDGLAARLLGGEVLRGPDDGRGLRHGVGGVGDRAGDAEVHHLHVAGRGEHHVARLDVAVDDPGAVAVVERRQHAAGDLQRTLGEDLASLAHDVAQRAALHALHHDVGLGHAGPVGGHLLARVVGRHDRGVVEGGR